MEARSLHDHSHVDTTALHMLDQCQAASQSCDACLESLCGIGSPGLFA